MNLGSRPVRLKAVWLLVVPFLILARPSPGLLALGAAVTFVGVLVRGWAAGLIKKDRELTVSGPYAHTRNPLYLGSFFIGLGVTVAGGQWYFVALFLAFFVVVYGQTMRNEESLLSEQFGEAYRRYREGVPLLIPRATPYSPGEATTTPSKGTWRFSMERYLGNKEWEAALGVLAGFAFLTAKMLWVG